MLFKICTIVSVIIMVSAQTGPKHDKLVFCYLYPKEFSRDFQPETLQPNLCTHIVYAYIGLVDFAKVPFKEIDKDSLITGFKRRNPHLKVGLAIGGDEVNYDEFSTLASDYSKRQKFAMETTNFLRTIGFDSLDLTWLHPNQLGVEPKDRDNFVSLLKELREEFDKHGDLLLTAGIDAKRTTIDDGFNITELSKYVDYLLLRAFDYHGSWEEKVGFNAPLRSNGDELNVHFTIDYLLQMGAPTSKIILGIPFYGRTFQTSNEGRIGNEADIEGFKGDGKHKSGYLAYNEICLTVTEENNWNRTYDSEADEVLAILHRDYNNAGTRVVTFDSSRSVANKVMFAMRKSLPGFMVWTVDADDYRGACTLDDDTFFDFKRYNEYPKRSNDSTYPLLRTINDATIYALEEIENDKKQKEEQSDLKEQFIQLQLQLKQEQEKKEEFEKELKKQKEQQMKQQMEEKLKLETEWDMRGQKLLEELYTSWQKQQIKQNQEKKVELENELKKLKEQQMKQIEEIEKKLKLKEEQEMREQQLQEQLKMQKDQVLKQEMEQQAIKNAQQNRQEQQPEISKEQKKSSTKEIPQRMKCLSLLTKKRTCLNIDLLLMANAR